MLRYTGHPIADIGVATVAAFCGKVDPTALTGDDLLEVARFLAGSPAAAKGTAAATRWAEIARPAFLTDPAVVLTC